jgi:hypothetical protein
VSRQVPFRTGDSFCAPRFADGTASIVFDLGMTCTADGVWRASQRFGGFVIGPMTQVAPALPAQCPLMVGAYLKPGRVAAFTGAMAPELRDKVMALDDLWRSSSAVAAQRADLDERERIARLEGELLRRVSRRSHPGINASPPSRRLSASGVDT